MKRIDDLRGIVDETVILVRVKGKQRLARDSECIGEGQTSRTSGNLDSSHSPCRDGSCIY